MRAALGVASECAPLVKTGGLADVAGALPGALAAQGWGLRTLIPGYPAVMGKLARARPRAVLDEADLFGGPARVLAARVEGLDLLVLDAPHLFDRAGTPYLDASGHDWPDNDVRFAALSWVAARIGAGGLRDWRPEVVHLHDWQAGLAAVYLHEMGAGVPSLMTVHNMAFHGLAGAARLLALRLPESGFHPDGFEFFGHINALKAGLVWADAISTVSPTYAQELARPDFGMGLDGVVRARAGDLAGILNGIDTDAWNPATDPHLVRGYASPRGKAPNRRALLAEFGLADGGGPLCVVVSRLSEQKGLDLLLQALPALTARGGRLILLGSGDLALENAWLAAASDAVAVRIGYDEALSHRMYAGADAVLVPSRFEPCGLTQLYGLRYGTLPLVRAVGGLADTVTDCSLENLDDSSASGFVFHHLDETSLLMAMRRSFALQRRPAEWRAVQRHAMRLRFDWGRAASAYLGVYQQAIAPI
jgi:starch synthase